MSPIEYVPNLELVYLRTRSGPQGPRPLEIQRHGISRVVLHYLNMLKKGYVVTRAKTISQFYECTKCKYKLGNDMEREITRK